MLYRNLLVALLLTAVSAGTYTPTFGPCPHGFSLVRSTGPSPGRQHLSSGERDYINSRRSEVIPQAWQSYLANVLATNVSLPRYVSTILSGDIHANGPNFGIAVSGGGYRAAIFGAGVLNVLDGRNASSVNVGTGGLLQAATYISGLSGGSWLVGSLAQANFPTIQDLIFGSSDPDAYSGWLTQFDVLDPGATQAEELTYLESLVGEVAGKYTEGLRVTITDVWARGLSRHFLNGTTADDIFNTSLPHGAGITFSGLTNLLVLRFQAVQNYCADFFFE
jgi:lysophospholipase